MSIYIENQPLMKSRIIKESEQITYPVLMQETNRRYIVLFNSEKEGIVIHGMGVYNMGHHSNNWTPATNKEVWKPFKGKIELSN